MIYKAMQSGSFPAGNHWAEGEVRALDVDVDVPAWLVPVKAPKKKAKAKPEAKAG